MEAGYLANGHIRVGHSSSGRTGQSTSKETPTMQTVDGPMPAPRQAPEIRGVLAAAAWGGLPSKTPGLKALGSFLIPNTALSFNY